MVVLGPCRNKSFPVEFSHIEKILSFGSVYQRHYGKQVHSGRKKSKGCQMTQTSSDLLSTMIHGQYHEGGDQPQRSEEWRTMLGMTWWESILAET